MRKIGMTKEWHARCEGLIEFFGKEWLVSIVPPIGNPRFKEEAGVKEQGYKDLFQRTGRVDDVPQKWWAMRQFDLDTKWRAAGCPGGWHTDDTIGLLKYVAVVHIAQAQVEFNEHL